MSQIQLILNENFYIKDPQNTELGKKILKHSIIEIDKLGFEHFTFKKLATAIGSTEASIYRYFDNKHRLLAYLVAWYWGWMEYQIDFQTHFINDPKEKLSKVIDLLSQNIELDYSFEHIDEITLQKIVIAESDKTYLTKNVDEDNKEGLFVGYKSLCNRISQIVQAINPEYPFANSLVITVLEASRQQVFFMNHLPALCSIKAGNEKKYEELKDFFEGVIFNTISAYEKEIN